MDNYVDAEFPAADTSLYVKQRDLIIVESSYIWLRPSQIYDQPFSINNSIYSEHFIQGENRDDNILSAFYYLADAHDLFNALILPMEVDASGKYTVRLFSKGKPKSVIIDDRFPCTKKKKPAFCSSKSRKIWPMLIEKAIAKMEGSYSAMLKLTTSDVLECLTGNKPIELLHAKMSKEKLNDILMKELNKRQICWAYPGSVKPLNKQVNPIPTQLKVCKLSYDNFDKVSYLEVIDPSKTPPNDCLFIDLPKYHQTYKKTCIAHYQTTSIQYSELDILHLAHSQSLFQITASRDVSGTINICIPASNLLGKIKVAQMFSLLWKKTETGYVLMQRDSEDDENVLSPLYESELQAGTYIVAFGFELSSESTDIQVNINSQTDFPIQLAKLNRKDLFLIRMLMEAVSTDKHANDERESLRIEDNPYGSKLKSIICYATDDNLFGCLYVENNTDDAVFYQRVEFARPNTNISYEYKCSKPGVYEITVGPHSKDIIVFTHNYCVNPFNKIWQTNTITKISIPKEDSSLSFHQIIWTTFDKIYASHPYCLISEQSNLYHIKSGPLTSSNLIASLQCVAEQKDLIKKLIKSTAPNKYTVKLFGSDKKTISAEGPFTTDGKFLCTHSTKNEVWPILFENAFATEFENYSNLRSVTVSTFLNRITGEDSIELNHNSVPYETIKEALLSSSTKSKIMCGNAKSDLPHEFGIKPSSCYPILKVINLKQGTILVKLKNNSNYKWAGKWGEADYNSWTEPMINLLNPKVLEDGVIYMQLNDYIKFFDKTTICLSQKGYNTKTLGIVQSLGDYSLIQINVENDATGIVSLSKERCPSNQSKKKDDFYIMGLLFSKLDKKYELLKLEYSKNNTIRLHNDKLIKKGEYILLLEYRFENRKENDMYLKIYSNGINTIKQLDKTKNTQLIKSLAIALINSEKAKPFITNYEADANSKVHPIIRYLPVTSTNLFGAIYAHNNSHDHDIKITATFSNPNEIKLIDDILLTHNKIEASLVPNQERILLFRHNNGSFQSKINITASIVQKAKKTEESIKLTAHSTETNEDSILYEDNEFPPNAETLFGPNKCLFSEKLKNWETYTWKRAEDIFQCRDFLVYKNIGLNDIKQGELGDCQFLSSISCIADKYPEIIESVFETNRVNRQGKYVIQLYVKGERRRVVVNDLFPCTTNGSPAFTKSVENEIWVMLLEKAYAKVHGSYAAIIGTTVMETFTTLTGAPTSLFYHIDMTPEELKEAYESAFSNGHIVCTGTMSNVPQNGLVSMHSYAVLGILNVNGKILVKIRNPWGEHEWTGKWSDKDESWTPELRKKFNVSDRDDGVFYMEASEFLCNFERSNVVYYDKKCLPSLKQVTHQNDSYGIVQIQIPQNTIGCFYLCSLFNWVDRCHAGDFQINAKLWKVNSDEYEFICTYSDTKRVNILLNGEQIAAGTYLIMYESISMNDEEKLPAQSVTICAYCNSVCEIKDIGISDIQLQKKIMKSLCKTTQTLNNLNSEVISEELKMSAYHYTSDNKAILGCIHVSNQSSSSAIWVRYNTGNPNLFKCLNYECKKEGEVIFTVPHNAEETILMKMNRGENDDVLCTLMHKEYNYEAIKNITSETYHYPIDKEEEIVVYVVEMPPQVIHVIKNNSDAVVEVCYKYDMDNAKPNGNYDKMIECTVKPHEFVQFPFTIIDECSSPSFECKEATYKLIV